MGGKEEMPGVQRRQQLERGGDARKGQKITGARSREAKRAKYGTCSLSRESVNIMGRRGLEQRGKRDRSRQEGRTLPAEKPKSLT